MQLEEIGDRLAIMDVLHRYTRVVDRGELEGLFDIFTDDGRFRIVDLPSGDRDFSISEFAAYLADTFLACNFMQHFMNNTLIELSGDQAQADSYLAVMYELKPGLTSAAFGSFDQASDLFLGGEYRDDLRRTADGWRIKTRTARFFSQRVRPIEAS